MKLLAALILLMICLTANGQATLTKKKKGFQVDTLIEAHDSRQRKLPVNAYPHIDTEIKYTDSTGNSVLIQNSLPLGGIGFTDVNGIRFGHRLFWSRIINKADTPLELTVTFPADSFALIAPDSYVKVLLHPDGMTQDIQTSLDGEKVMKHAGKLFWDTTRFKSLSHTATNFRKTIAPNEACVLYTVVLHHQGGNTESRRSGYALKENGLFYKLRKYDPVFVHCGQISFKRGRLQK